MSEKTNSGFIIPDYDSNVDIPTLIRQNADAAEAIIKSTDERIKKVEDAAGKDVIDGGTY